MSTIVNVPKATATATSGCVRRHGRGPTTASAAMQQQRERRHVLAKHHFDHGPADQYCDQDPVPWPRVRGVRGSRFGPQRAECVGGHAVSLGSPRGRRIRRKYKRTTVPTARSNQAPGLMCPPPASVTVGSTYPHRDKEHHDETLNPTAENPPPRWTTLRLPGAGQARSGVDQLHVPLRLRRHPRLLQARLDRRHPGRRRLRVRHQPRPLSSLALTLMAIPILMILLSMTLPARVEPHHEPRRGIGPGPLRGVQRGGRVLDVLLLRLSIGLEVLLLAFILRSAWTWPRRTTSPAATTTSLETEPLRMQHQS